jgi:hypothetical protein
MILSAIAEKLKCRSKADFKGRHYEASSILHCHTRVYRKVTLNDQCRLIWRPWKSP